MPKFKVNSNSLVEIAKLLEEVKPKRQHIKVSKVQLAPTKVYIPQSIGSKPTIDYSENIRKADEAWRQYDRAVRLGNVEEMGPIARKFVDEAMIKGRFGHRPTGNTRSILPEASAIPDYIKTSGTNTLYGKADRDFLNAEAASQLVDFENARPEPRLPMQFYRSGLDKLYKLWTKPSQVVEDVHFVGGQPRLISGAQSYAEKFPGRPVTTIQTDSEYIFRPRYLDINGNVRHSSIPVSSYDTMNQESFEDMYRRVTRDNSIKLLDDPYELKKGGKCK